MVFNSLYCNFYTISGEKMNLYNATKSIGLLVLVTTSLLSASSTWSLTEDEHSVDGQPGTENISKEPMNITLRMRSLRNSLLAEKKKHLKTFNELTSANNELSKSTRELSELRKELSNTKCTIDALFEVFNFLKEPALLYTSIIVKEYLTENDRNCDIIGFLRSVVVAIKQGVYFSTQDEKDEAGRVIKTGQKATNEAIINFENLLNHIRSSDKPKARDHAHDIENTIKSLGLSF